MGSSCSFIMLSYVSHKEYGLTSKRVVQKSRNLGVKTDELRISKIET